MPVNSFENYPMSWRPQKDHLTKPYYKALANLLEQDILSGKLKENTKLPPQRELADFLDLNLSTITRAYKLCELKGLLYAVTGRGTFIAAGIDAQNTFVDQASSTIEMGMIKPFYACNASILSASQVVLQETSSDKLLEYSAPFGTKEQIKTAESWLRSFGLNVTTEQIFLTAGAQNALSVILIALFHAGDKIAVDHFTYTNFKGLANFLHIQLISIDTDRDGMMPEALMRACKNTVIKGVYLMPTCSNPTSVYMPLQRRQKIACLAEQFHLLIIEDDIYSFLDPYHTASFFSILPKQTIHICSLSKSLCAGLRVAFLVFPLAYREILATGILDINLKTVSLNAEIARVLIDSGEAKKIAQKKIALSKSRNKIFYTIFPGEITDAIPRFYHWMLLPNKLTSEEAELRAVSKGIHVLGSHRFSVADTQGRAYLRIATASPDTENDLIKGLMLLKSILEENKVDFLV